MGLERIDFLEELLNTYSPSGREEEIQLKWGKYVSQYAHELRTDVVGNMIAILNPEAKYKVLITGHCDEISFIVQYIDDKGYIYFTEAGGIKAQNALGSRFKVLGKYGVVDGIVGVNAAHHGEESTKVNAKDLYLDCGFNSKAEALEKVAVGDSIVYDLGVTYLQNGCIAARGLDNRTGAFIVAEVIRRLSQKDIKVGVYGVSTVCEETNMAGAYSAGSSIAPDVALVSDVSFATDYPDLNQKELGDVSLGKGAILSQGSPINKKLNEKIEAAAKANNLDIQFELTPRLTGTDADKIKYTNMGVPVALISLPLRYMHSPSEIVQLSDIENTIEVFCKTIESFTGDECFNPIDLKNI